MIRVKILSVVAGALQRFTGRGRTGEEFRLREMMQHYGFVSRPLAGAEGIALQKGNTTIMIATEDRRYRLAVENGEVALYTDEGDKIHLKRDREIEISSGAVVRVVAPRVTVAADQVELGGDSTLFGVVTGQCACTFTGAPHPDVSFKVKAQKGAPVGP